ncbi:GNAT family N-acetyltransferase [Streptomyces sp. NPDC006692]|uniref:GNAT family N-acetyltransferase n=1 Tax=Streptomyces sp. NPDC006692 TaxID=3364758 RepID=UPI003699AA50
MKIRTLDTGEHRAALDLFHDSLHQPPVADRDWSSLSESLEPGGVRGAFRDDRLIAMHQCVPSDIVVPGGELVPLSVQFRFAVRAGHTRRGVGTTLMTAALRATPEPLAVVRPSEGGVYGRFGFGVATRCRDLVIDRRRAVLAAEAPSGGDTYVPVPGEAAGLCGEVYGHTRSRPGSIGRRPWYEQLMDRDLSAAGLFPRIVVHTGSDGPDGIVRYSVRGTGGGATARTVLDVDEMHWRTPRAWLGLWRFLLGVELVDEIRLRSRPLDEPVEWLFTDPRVCRVTDVRDEVWLRTVDVLAALRARTYGDGGSVVMDVHDPVLPDNSGHYLVGADEVCRTREPAQLTLSVNSLAAIYLGGVRPSALAAAGGVVALDSTALSTADRLFRTDAEPWCGTYI